MDSQAEIDIIPFTSVLYCNNCRCMVKIREIRAIRVDAGLPLVMATIQCPICKIPDTWTEFEWDFMEKFEDYFTKKEAMTKSNPIDYLENSGIRATPCCNRDITSIFRSTAMGKQTILNGTGLVKCTECDKPYTVTIDDSLITSITPTQDAIA